jgi:hypothetical protein
MVRQCANVGWRIAYISLGASEAGLILIVLGVIIMIGLYLYGGHESLV